MGIDIVEQSIYDIHPDLLNILLLDRTTKKYIRWGSDNYSEFGPEYQIDQEISPDLIIGLRTNIIQPRVSKSDEEQTKRTRDKAEVFTPSWVCNEQNNLVDSAWFGRTNVFNESLHTTWQTSHDTIYFPDGKTWQDYIYAKRMEIACGEAPYLVSRYDTVTGTPIPIRDRIGILDRKLRIVNENVTTKTSWLQWITIAFQSCYGYDFQGDNILLARENLLYTFIEYYIDRIGIFPSLPEMKKIANIISWNIWQMNGLTMTAPFSFASPAFTQLTLFDLFDINKDTNELDAITSEEIPCIIYDWYNNESLEFRSIIKED